MTKEFWTDAMFQQATHVRRGTLKSKSPLPPETWVVDPKFLRETIFALNMTILNRGAWLSKYLFARHGVVGPFDHDMAALNEAFCRFGGGQRLYKKVHYLADIGHPTVNPSKAVASRLFGNEQIGVLKSLYNEAICKAMRVGERGADPVDQPADEPIDGPEGDDEGDVDAGAIP